MTRSRRLLWTLFVGYLLLLAVVLLAPASDSQSAAVSWLSHLLRQLGLPAALFGYKPLEVVMNAVIMTPLGFLGSLLWMRPSWRDWTASAFVIALSVEAFQGVGLPDRTPSFSDVVANTGGVMTGALAVALLRFLRDRRGRTG